MKKEKNKVIKIIVDSAPNISMEEVKTLGITMIPMSISFGFDKEYYDGVDITPKEFYKKLIESDELPKTSQINAYIFLELFKELTMDDSMLQKYVKDSAHLWIEHTSAIPSYIIGSTIGTHVGPGAIGVTFFEK